jgi:hypothetical protein
VVGPRTLLLVLALLQAIGVTELVRRATCEEECEGDGCDNDCTPGGGSPSCVCHCPSAPTATPPSVAVSSIAPPTRSSAVTFEHSDRRHRSPDPREIQHVPRARVV